MAGTEQQDIQRVIDGYNRAKIDTEYAASIKMEAEEIEETRYRFNISESNIYGGGE